MVQYSTSASPSTGGWFGRGSRGKHDGVTRRERVGVAVQPGYLHLPRPVSRPRPRISSMPASLHPFHLAVVLPVGGEVVAALEHRGRIQGAGDGLARRRGRSGRRAARCPAGAAPWTACRPSRNTRRPPVRPRRAPRSSPPWTTRSATFSPTAPAPITMTSNSRSSMCRHGRILRPAVAVPAEAGSGARPRAGGWRRALAGARLRARGCGRPGRHTKRSAPADRCGFSFCAPKGIRTPDLLFRRQTLYPAELWAHSRLLENFSLPEPRITLREEGRSYKSKRV